MANLGVVTNFIRSGSCYLLLKNLINEYGSQVLADESRLSKNILDSEVELAFLHDRAKNLEALRQRFPSNVAVANQQVMDLKDSNAKFMPISTQLVAVNADINNTVESLARMRKKFNQISVLKSYVTQAAPILQNEANALNLTTDLLKLEETLRAQLNPHDINAQQLLNTIRFNITEIETRFTKGLNSTSNPYVSDPSIYRPALIGLLLGLLFSVALSIYRHISRHQTPRNSNF